VAIWGFTSGCELSAEWHLRSNADHARLVLLFCFAAAFFLWNHLQNLLGPITG
jgi:hypothetical protein